MTRMPQRRGRGLAPALRAAVLLIALLPPPALAGEAPARADAACAALGAGFRRLPGSDTCVQIKGSADVAVGRNAAPGNAPNQGLQNAPTTDSSPASPDPWQRTR